MPALQRVVLPPSAAGKTCAVPDGNPAIADLSSVVHTQIVEDIAGSAVLFNYFTAMFGTGGVPLPYTA